MNVSNSVSDPSLQAAACRGSLWFARVAHSEMFVNGWHKLFELHSHMAWMGFVRTALPTLVAPALVERLP